MIPFPAEVLAVIVDYSDRSEVVSLLKLNSEHYRAISKRVRTRLDVKGGELGRVRVVASSPGKKVPPLHEGWIPSMVEFVRLYSDNDLRHLLSNGSLEPPMKVLQPSKLVIRDPTRNWRRTHEGVDPHAVKHQVFILGPSLLGSPPDYNAKIHWGHNQLPRVEMITVVFPTLPGELWFSSKEDVTHVSKERWIPPEEWLKRQLNALLNNLTSLYGRPGHRRARLTIVNGGSVYRRTNGRNVLSQGNAFRRIAPYKLTRPERARKQSELEDTLRRYLWEVAIPRIFGTLHNLSDKQVHNLVRFCTMEEWIAESSAEGVLDEEEISPWVTG